ncbi:MAG TPA: glycine cleavage T C-terminal barrel domain-containing protein, partial [Pyrinomonadaceae bacterium]|nr:glycine cleavage T C-terminal barrel domain-containing protein [Pyrinomonadaceae bacterium]
EAVSYTKGCYAGQEIIARIHWRGHVAKKLAGLVLEREAELTAGARVRSCEEGGREVGRVTSNVYSPRLNRRIALGLVKHDHLAPGTEVKIFDGEAEVCGARVAELPFVRGSWYADEVGSAEETGA